MARATEDQAEPAATGKQTAAPATVKVTFARDYTLSGGPYDDSPKEQSFKNGDTADIPADRVDEVLRHGSARPHDARLAKIFGFPASEENKEG
jgi:hypothetical protein